LHETGANFNIINNS